MPDTPIPPSPGERSPAPSPPPPPRLRLPSRRATVLLAVSMLALGVAIGAAIGPAPGSSLASSGSIVGSVVVPYLNELERAELASTTTQTTSATATVPRQRRRRHRKAASSATTTATISTTATTTSSSTTASAPATTVAPVTSVWLVELSGGTFAEALAQPAAAPDIDSKIVPTGTLLSSWTALDASAFAGEAALLAGQPASADAPQPTLQTITEPLCPEGAAGASCASGTAGALTAADTFLAQTLAVITATPAYGAHGLIVVTFGTLASGSASGLAAGSQSATLLSKPPAGVLLISPFTRAGARPSIAFNPSSPKQSVEQLLPR